MSLSNVDNGSNKKLTLEWLKFLKSLNGDPDFQHLVISLFKDKELKSLAKQTSQDVSGKILALMLLDLRKAHPEYAPYFESLLKSGQSKPNLALLIQVAQWLINQPAEFHANSQNLLEKSELVGSFYKALRLWGDQLTLQQAQSHSKIRELYLNELFPDIKQVRVPVGVVHEESHHPNQVDMIYVCAMAEVLEAQHIFEFGTYRGQTTCGLAAISNNVSVYTLNLPPEKDPRYAPYIGAFIKASPYKDRIHQLFADSTRFDTAEYAASMDYIFIDADHSYEGVKNDTQKALEMLKPGGTIVWHDYAAKSPGVYRYIQEFAAEKPVFRIRNTCLIVYRDGVNIEQFEPASLPSSLEAAEYKTAEYTSDNLVQQYLKNGQIPWSEGYKPYRMQKLQATVTDQALLATFREQKSLPENYGYGLDERVVEYPWVLSRLGKGDGHLLDAGSTLNYPYLLDLPLVASKQVVILTLAPETTIKRDNVSYLYGDLRDVLLRDNAFQWIVCISTLEHVGLDNTRLYTSDDNFKEKNTQDYRVVMAEFRRLLAPGGRLLLTVPFGQARNLGWMQQFDQSGIAEIVAAFGRRPLSETYFQYLPTGWVLSDDKACVNCEYFDVHSAKEPAPDRAAAARAVACLEFIKES